MIKIEFIIRPEKLDPTKEALSEFGIKGMTIAQVMGFGLQKGMTKVYRGQEIMVNLLPKIKVEIVTTEDQVDKIVKIITDISRTGKIGDGKIFISEMKDAIRVRTGESGEKALQ